MTTLRQNRNTRDRQRGVALIAALIALLLIAAITAGMIILSNTETNISSNFRDEQTAYFASRGGLAEVRDRMRGGATDSIKANIPTNLPGTAGGILYITNPLGGEADTPWNTTGPVSTYPDDQICTELPCVGGVPAGGAWYTHPAGVAGTGSPTYVANQQLVWKWVRVMPKVNRTDTTTRVTSVDGASIAGQPTLGGRVCWDGINNHEVVVTVQPTCQLANANYLPVYELTSLAVTPSGSRRIAQYELAKVVLPTIPGSVVFDGSNPSFGPPNSNAFQVDGTDRNQGPNAGAGCGLPTNVSALGAYDNPSAVTLTNDAGKRINNYKTTAPAVPISNVNPALGSLSTVDGLSNLATMVTSAAGSNVYPNGTAPLNMGTIAAPVINVVQGDLSLGGSGSGILLVTGQLTLLGNFSYDGVILVIGEGAVVKNGGGGGTLNGAMLVANLYANVPPPGPYPAYNNPIPLGANNAPGIPYFRWNGGGNASINYDSCWINAVGDSLPLRLVTSRELIY